MLAAWFAFLMIFCTSKPGVFLDHGPFGVDVIVRSHGIGFFRDPIARPDLMRCIMELTIWRLFWFCWRLFLLRILSPTFVRVLKLHLDCGHHSYAQPAGCHPFPGFAGHCVRLKPAPWACARTARGGVILGMASTRNTGFARYAAISALVALPGLMRKGSLAVRIIWGDSVHRFALRLGHCQWPYGNIGICRRCGRDPGAERAKRMVNFLVGDRGRYSPGFAGVLLRILSLYHPNGPY